MESKRFGRLVFTRVDPRVDQGSAKNWRKGLGTLERVYIQVYIEVVGGSKARLGPAGGVIARTSWLTAHNAHGSFVSLSLSLSLSLTRTHTHTLFSFLFHIQTHTHSPSLIFWKSGSLDENRDHLKVKITLTWTRENERQVTQVSQSEPKWGAKSSTD